ncbi:hypothetical protein BC936DRAFT_137215 [Jimgerdemannia flammicorona]|uniref:Uncharacterized protein n=1 Tax=Jimgerdemannia flammicorona TaxID=994334 RepID=A0A433CXV6_9FUNG|nr:hypothetical protein BC936DRAFT_137215 [Jimgerdemannia flammicorona]
MNKFRLNASGCQPYTSISKFFATTPIEHWKDVDAFTKHVYEENPMTTAQEVFNNYTRSLSDITRVKDTPLAVAQCAQRLREDAKMNRLKTIGDTLLGIRRERAKRRKLITYKTRRNFQAAATNDKINLLADVYADESPRKGGDSDGEVAVEGLISGESTSRTFTLNVDLDEEDSSNPFLVSTTIAKNSLEEDAGGEGKMSDQDYEEEDEYTDAQYNIDDLKSKGMLNARKHGLDGDKTCQLRKKITTMDSTEDLDEDENVPAVVLGDTDSDKIVDAGTNGKVIDGWMLPDGRNVGELFTKYRATIRCVHIFDLADVALVHHARSLSDDDELWSEIEDAWDAKWGNYRPSEHVREYMTSLRKV